MSFEKVAQFTRELPPRLREDVLGYARSVRAALPEIFREAGLQQDALLGDKLVFLAGVKKLYAICSAAFWILDNSLNSLKESNVTTIKLGSAMVSRGSHEWQQLHAAVNSLETILDKQGLLDLIKERSHAVILDRLQHGR